MKELRASSTWLLLIVFLVASLLALTFAFRWGGRGGLFLMLLAVLSLFSIFFWLGQDRLMSWFKNNSFASHEIKGQDLWSLGELQTELLYLSRSARPEAAPLLLEPCNLHLSECASPILFVSHTFRGQPVLVFSRGLLDTCSRDERLAMLTLGVALREKLSGLFAQFLFLSLNSALGLAQFLDEISPWNWFGRTKKFEPFQLACSILIFSVSRLFLTNEFFFKLDRRVTEIGIPPRVLAGALWKLSALAQTKPLLVPSCFLSQFPVEPFLVSGRPTLHPHFRQRIERIVGYFPL